LLSLGIKECSTVHAEKGALYTVSKDGFYDATVTKLIRIDEATAELIVNM